MSESQDVMDLIEDVITVDRVPRLSTQPPYQARVFFEAAGYTADGQSVGLVSVYENEEMRWAGLDIGQDGDIYVVMTPATERFDAPDQPTGKILLKGTSVGRTVPAMLNDINRTIASETGCYDLLDMRNELAERTRGKPALIDLCQRHLTEGRRAVLEELHERTDEDAEQFYARNDEYGMF